MAHEYTQQRLEGWVADFCASDGLVGQPAAVHEHASTVLLQWLLAACDLRDVEPEDIGVADLREALLKFVARLDVPAAVHERVPGLCRDFLADLEAAGRLEDGRAMGLTLYAGRPAYERALSGKLEPITRPGSKLGRNDPCPCGSGKKYKRCCMKT
jgi:hypothetical protein